ncbi:hypothetical protein ACP275_14G134500 [Erythranthe tilingii]
MERLHLVGSTLLLDLVFTIASSIRSGDLMWQSGNWRLTQGICVLSSPESDWHVEVGEWLRRWRWNKPPSQLSDSTHGRWTYSPFSMDMRL